MEEGRWLEYQTRPHALVLEHTIFLMMTKLDFPMIQYHSETQNQSSYLRQNSVIFTIGTCLSNILFEAEGHHSDFRCHWHFWGEKSLQFILRLDTVLEDSFTQWPCPCRRDSVFSPLGLWGASLLKLKQRKWDPKEENTGYVVRSAVPASSWQTRSLALFLRFFLSVFLSPSVSLLLLFWQSLAFNKHTTRSATSNSTRLKPKSRRTPRHEKTRKRREDSQGWEQRERDRPPPEAQSANDQGKKNWRASYLLTDTETLDGERERNTERNEQHGTRSEKTLHTILTGLVHSLDIPNSRSFLLIWAALVEPPPGRRFFSFLLHSRRHKSRCKSRPADQAQLAWKK